MSMDMLISLLIAPDHAKALSDPASFVGMVETLFEGRVKVKGSEIRVPFHETPAPRVVGGRYAFWIAFPFDYGPSGRPAIDGCSGDFIIDASGYGWLGFGVGEHAGYPNRDMGPFLLRYVLPICRSTDCVLGIMSWNEHVDTGPLIKALKDLRLPAYATAYYLSRPFVESIGLENVRSVHQEMLRRWQAKLRKAGLRPEATPEEIMESDELGLDPRPILAEEPDGSVLLVGGVSMSMGKRLGL